MITNYKTDSAEALGAISSKEPKNITISGSITTIATGEDYEAPQAVRTIQAWEFRDRFTQGEMLAITSLAYGGDKAVQLLLLKLQTANAGVTLDSKETIGGVDYLISKGAVESGRKTSLLA